MMNDLISRSALIEYLDKAHYNDGSDWLVNQYNADWIYSWIESQPTIEAEPVRHGAWIEDGYNGNPFVCSYCGHEGCYSGNFNNKQYYYTNYCPNCGAKMDKENDDESSV